VDVNAGGGVSDVWMTGHVPKRELYSAMFAFIEGRYSAQAALDAKVGAL